jgi:hypothetical protein
MSRKDITDEQVIMACDEFQSRRYEGLFVTDILMRDTGQPEKVCIAAMERAEKRGLIECGVSLRTAWVVKQ